MRVSSTLSSCLALVAALPGAQSLSRHPDDHALLDLDNIIAERLDLVLKPCTDPLASDADAEDPREVYKGLGCKSLLDGLNYNYTQGKDDTDISYVEYGTGRVLLLCFVTQKLTFVVADISPTECMVRRTETAQISTMKRVVIRMFSVTTPFSLAGEYYIPLRYFFYGVLTVVDR